MKDRLIEKLKELIYQLNKQPNSIGKEWRQRVEKLELQINALESEIKPKKKRDPHAIYGPGDDNYGRDKWKPIEGYDPIKRLSEPDCYNQPTVFLIDENGPGFTTEADGEDNGI